MKFEVVKSTVNGTQTYKRRRTDIIGNNMPDSFFDSFEAEGLACYDIIGKIDGCVGEFVNVTFNKSFLRQIVHSHMLHIKELENGITGKVYGH